MKRSLFIACFILAPLLFESCTHRPKEVVEQPQNQFSGMPDYDMRQNLVPSRLTIAMWDFSWIYMHYEKGAFEDWGKTIDEAKERGFNTIRIDAFPLIIDKMQSEDEEVTIEGDPLRNWGATDKDRKHRVIRELVEFVSVAHEKGVYLILSTWNQNCLEYPDIRTDYAKNKAAYWRAWEKTLNILEEKGLFKNVLYVDLDQEFPFFSPMKTEITVLGEQMSTVGDDMEQAGNTQNLRWNQQQLAFIKDYLDSSLKHFQAKYPHLRFTFSLTGYWKEIRSMQIKNFDVLELHLWLTQMERFKVRSGFGQFPMDRDDRDYSQYTSNIEATMQSVRPMLLKEMHNQIKFAIDWSEEIAAPLTTSEAWGPWWHGDQESLKWMWLYDWCEESMALSAEYGFWGSTPWNFSHPYWNNWENISWYQRVNNHFLTN